MESKSSETGKKDDLGWNHNHLKDPEKRYRVTCNFCGFTSSGGIYRAKQHQMGGFPNVKPCERVPLEVKEELQALYCKKRELNVRKKQNEPDVNLGDDADDVEVEQVERNSMGKRALVEKPGFSKAKKTKSLMDPYPQRPGEVVDMRKKQRKLRQTSMDDSTDPAREKTIQDIAKFFDEAGIPFDAAQWDSFMDMVEAIGKYGPGLKPPSYDELKALPLKKKMPLAKNLLKNHQEKCAKTNEDESTYDTAGCSGGPTTQSSPHNKEFQLKEHTAFCAMLGIKELRKVLSEVYREINTETSKGKAVEEQEFSEEFKLLSECHPDTTEEEEKWLDEWCKEEFMRKWQERFKKFLEDEGITDKFKVVCLKYKEEDERQYSENCKQLCEEFEKDELFNVDALLKFCYPEMLAGNLAGSLNVPSNCEGELQSSSTRTTPLTANAMKSTATGGKPQHDPLAMQGGTTATAGCSGGSTTLSSPHNAKV